MPADVSGLSQVHPTVIQDWNLVLGINGKKLRRELLSLGKIHFNGLNICFT